MCPGFRLKLVDEITKIIRTAFGSLIGYHGARIVKVHSSCLERVVVVRPTYILFSLETQSSKGHLNIYPTFSLSRSSVERGRVI